MKPPPCEIDSPSVVLVGHFNPKIFQPGWLARHDLLSDDVAKAAIIDIVRPEVSVFTVHDDVRFGVELDRCIVEAKTPRHEQTVLALTQGCFTLLEHSPIRAMASTARCTSAWPTRKRGIRSATGSHRKARGRDC